MAEKQNPKERLNEITDSQQICENSSHIEVEGHLGTWYIINTNIWNDTRYYLLEHEEQVDEPQLKELATSVIAKLNDMSDEDFIAVSNELIADFEYWKFPYMHGTIFMLWDSFDNLQERNNG